jgi:hypothetical protein
MNLAQFFEHWHIVENPFRGEEARHDSVFARVGFSPAVQGAAGVVADAASGPVRVTGFSSPVPMETATSHSHITFHSDFEKILGDLAKPSTAIVFGEKGSGKTAIRLQIDDRVGAHNASHPEAKILLVPYDDLNGILDRFHRRVAGKTPAESFQKFRLVDHLDAIISLVVPRLVDSLVASPKVEPGAVRDVGMDLGPEPRKTARKLDVVGKRDLMLLQAVYDKPDVADLRTARLRRILRVPLPTAVVIWRLLAIVGWAPAAMILVWAATTDRLAIYSIPAYMFLGLLALWLAVVAKVLAWDNLAMVTIARRARKQLRVLGRSDASLARSLKQLDPVARDTSHLPQTESDEVRYAMLDRLKRTFQAFGFAGMLVVIDRVDEPTLISGDPERMRAVIWPLFNNKFLQQERIGVKMLLPIELRHALFKESSAFFQEARLDKQSLVERLSWTGAMLYDLCDARLKACLDPGSAAAGPDGQGPIGLLDLFAEDVTARDLVDALDQMHQPRDAFKFLYACIGEHCSNVTAEQAQWRIPRLVLETVRKQQSERVQQLYRGIRPA